MVFRQKNTRNGVYSRSCGAERSTKPCPGIRPSILGAKGLKNSVTGAVHMKLQGLRTAWLAIAAVTALSSCSGDPEAAQAQKPQQPQRSTIWDLFSNSNDPNKSIQVNRYLWVASLDVLNFLPIESADPFTGVISTGYGTPPGGGGSYRATIYIQDAALEARSVKVAVQSRGGPVSAQTERAIEDAIMTRARQLRIRDGKL